MEKPEAYNFIETDESKYRFLVVDDEPDMLELIAGMLKERYKKAQVFTAEDGLQAIMKFKNSPPTVLITDLSIPKLSGDELLTNILAQYHGDNLSIVVVSGLSRENRNISEILNGHFRFLSKPFREAEFLKIIDTAIKQPPPIQNKFKLDAVFLMPFILGPMKYSKKGLEESLEKEPPFIAKDNHISGDLSFSSTFTTKDFQGFLSICFTKDSCLYIQKKQNNGGEEINQKIIQNLTDDIFLYIADELLAVGFIVKFEHKTNCINKPQHRAMPALPGNTIVLPLCSDHWRLQLELTVNY